MKPIIGITVGDINGIGHEVILKTFIDKYIFDICIPIIYGNSNHVRQFLSILKEDKLKSSIRTINEVKDAKDGLFNIIDCYANDIQLQVGTVTQQGGKAALNSLQRAVTDIKNGGLHALVTAPINKQNIQSDKFHFPGHTEYLAHCCDKKESLMLMVSDQLKVALVTNHLPISEVSKQLSKELILEKMQLLKQTLQQDFSIDQPRIAVLALNPHAGDSGFIGKEEMEIINPAIEQAQKENILAFGPYSADGFFGTAHYQYFDAVLAMYHDQGMIPFKSLDMDGVNFTAGLPIIRTSPAHGTAYELAGKGEASPQSFKNAVYLAIDILKRRNENIKLKENALHIVIPEKTSAPIINLEEELAQKE